MTSLIKYTATWCGPCKKLEPILHQLQLDLPNLSITVVDVDEEPELAKEYKIKSLPTLIFIKDKEEINRIAGLTTLNEIKKLL